MTGRQQPVAPRPAPASSAAARRWAGAEGPSRPAPPPAPHRLPPRRRPPPKRPAVDYREFGRGGAGSRGIVRAGALHAPGCARRGRGQAGMQSSAYMQGRVQSPCAQNSPVRFARLRRGAAADGPAGRSTASLLAIVVDPALIGIDIGESLAHGDKTPDRRGGRVPPPYFFGMVFKILVFHQQFSYNFSYFSCQHSLVFLSQRRVVGVHDSQDVAGGVGIVQVEREGACRCPDKGNKPLVCMVNNDMHVVAVGKRVVASRL